MSKSTYHTRVPLPSSLTSPDIENLNSMETSIDYRRTTASNDKRLHNVNYVRHVLRRFFGGYNRKSSPFVSDENSLEQSPILIHPLLQYDKHTKFSGKNTIKKKCFSIFYFPRRFITRLVFDTFRRTL